MPGCAGCMGATIKCAFGVAPTPHTPLPIPRVMISKKPAANITAQIPMGNIVPFGMCMSPANPAVIAATAAALGVFTPMPCVPVTVAPWTPGNPTVLVGGMPVQNQTSILMCAWGGVINTIAPGQFQMMA